MYNDNTNFSIKNVIIQFLFVALFIFILVWLFPLKSDLKNVTTCNGDTCSNTVLYDSIFNTNVLMMKDSAKDYFTTERLPKKVGNKVKLTLGEMLNLKIILPFVDKNGDTCSLDESYVEVTKHETEYVMKVNLKCGEQENYLLVYMGCYDYCSTTICEKNNSDVKNPTIYPVNPQPEQKYYCKVVNSKFYDKNGNVVSERAFNESCNSQPEQKYYCKVVNNKFYDKNGNVVSEKAFNESCNSQPEEKYYCKVVNNKFYDKNGNVVSEKAFNESCNSQPEEKYYCKVVNNKYYDKNGNVVSETEYNKSCKTEEVKEYLYEYIKKTDGYYKYSDWSEWQLTEVKADANTAIKTKTVNQKKLIGYNVTTTTDKSQPIYGTKEVQIGTEEKTVCKKYDYVKTGEYSYGEYKYVKTEYLTYTPKDTTTTKYVYVSEDPDVCTSNCTASTTKAYKVYVRSATPVTKYQCVETGVETKPITTTIQVITGYKTIQTKEPVYKTTTVKYYSYMKRTWVEGTIDTKWSVKNDTTLLSAGYSYTGNTKLITK